MPEDRPHEDAAREYLSRELGDAAPDTLVHLARFSEGALEGEDDMSVFSFSASLGGNPPESFHVVAGQTVPNYYPGWNLSPEEIYTLHLGTRFMLVMEIQQAPLERLPASLEADVADQLTRVAPAEPLSAFRPVAAFQLEDQLHAVCRLRIAHEEVYLLAGDLPLGIYRRIDLPPHVVYRLHLGTIIRREATDEDDAA